MLHADSPTAALDFLADRECDAAAGLTDFLFNASERMEGFRMVDGVFSRIPQTIAVHKRATNASLFIANFVQRLIDIHRANGGVVITSQQGGTIA
ncbi:hypothetical protein [Rhizobium sp. R339]|uniref:hypothetical protein n=1 Tax=Rhizobium sp. R339 TaxID=1764273 RepID=UPI00167EBC08|nr:hypothetical protein [Rhizobium sp. R339]